MEEFRTTIKQKGGSEVFIVVLSHEYYPHPGGVLINNLDGVDAGRDLVGRFDSKDELRQVDKTFLICVSRNPYSSRAHPLARTSRESRSSAVETSWFCHRPSQDYFVTCSELVGTNFSNDSNTDSLYLDELDRIGRDSASDGETLLELLNRVSRH